jgi:hypothetical protein
MLRLLIENINSIKGFGVIVKSKPSPTSQNVVARAKPEAILYFSTHLEIASSLRFTPLLATTK